MKLCNINGWKPEPEGSNIKHGYSMASNYYICRRIDGIIHYKITNKGIFKINEKRLNKETHNFLVYLRGHGNKLISESEFENGDIR